jgi:hypothetical protein
VQRKWDGRLFDGGVISFGLEVISRITGSFISLDGLRIVRNFCDVCGSLRERHEILE